MQLDASENLYFMLGLSLAEQGQFQEAIDCYHVIFEKGAATANHYFNRGKAWYCLGKLEEAYQDFKQSIQLDPYHLESYKFMGLIQLNLHNPSEAYANLYAYLKAVNALNLPSEQSHHSDFLKGVIRGLIESGSAHLLELGPFLSHLVFYPTSTTQEIMKCVNYLVAEIGSREWKTVCDLLTPELKELYLTFNQSQEEQKGYWTGQFIGRNGIGAVVGMQIKQALNPITEVSLPKQAEEKWGLKKMKPNIQTSSFELPLLPHDAIPIYPKDCWIMPYPALSRTLIGTQFYPDHALVRIAPRSCDQIYSLLERQISKATEEMGTAFYKENSSHKKKLRQDLEGKKIYPILIEPFLANPTTRGIKVILDHSDNLVRIEKLSET